MRNHIQLADAYYRLSDEERKYGESASITNQRTIVRGVLRKVWHHPGGGVRGRRIFRRQL